MFIIRLKYVKPLDEVDRFVGEHRAFLEQHYASGCFLLSGRLHPRTGGIILASAVTQDEVASIVARDPFYREGLAEYEIIEFIPTMTAPELSKFKVA